MATISTKRNQKSLDDVSQEMLFQGLNQSQICRAFGMDARTVQAKIHGVQPCGTRHGSKIWQIKDVAPYLVKPAVDVETYIKTMHHNDLPKHLTKEFWAGQRARQEYLLKEGDLWPTHQVVTKVGELMKIQAMALKLLVDTIDRQSELSEKQKRIVREISDATLADLARGVKEHFGRAQARVEAEEALRLETEAAVAKSRDELNEDDDESL